MTPQLATIAGVACGVLATVPLALALALAARRPRPSAKPGRGVVAGVVCVICSFAVAQGALAYVYVKDAARIDDFGIPLALAFLAAATVEALVGWCAQR